MGEKFPYSARNRPFHTWPIVALKADPIPAILAGPIASLFPDGLAADLAVHPEPEEGEERLEEVSIGPSSPARYPFQISEDRCWSHRRWEKLDRVQGRVERPYCLLY